MSQSTHHNISIFSKLLHGSSKCSQWHRVPCITCISMFDPIFSNPILLFHVFVKYPTSRKRLLRTAWRPWASISFCSKAVTIFATVPRSGCTTAVRRSSKSLPSTWLDKSWWILLLIREFGKIKIYIIHELFVILFIDAYDILMYVS